VDNKLARIRGHSIAVPAHACGNHFPARAIEIEMRGPTRIFFVQHFVCLLKTHCPYTVTPFKSGEIGEARVCID
jgi:hypothetical protein